MSHVVIKITNEMIQHANKALTTLAVRRTVSSPFDTLAGVLGELVFAQLIYGDFKLHDLYSTKGKEDFLDTIEIKTSAFPFSSNLNLLVRQDYAVKRKPLFYVQIILNIPYRHMKEIPAGTEGIICGYASSKEIDEAPLKDFGSKFGGKGGYKCHYISISNLKPIADVVDYVKKLSQPPDRGQ